MAKIGAPWCFNSPRFSASSPVEYWGPCTRYFKYEEWNATADDISLKGIQHAQRKGEEMKNGWLHTQRILQVFAISTNYSVVSHQPSTISHQPSAMVIQPWTNSVEDSSGLGSPPPLPPPLCLHSFFLPLTYTAPSTIAYSIR